MIAAQNSSNIRGSRQRGTLGLSDIREKKEVE